MFNKNRRSSSSISNRHVSSISSCSLEQPQKQDYKDVFSIFNGIRKFFKTSFKQQRSQIDYNTLQYYYQQSSKGMKKYQRIFQYHQQKTDDITKQLQNLHQKYMIKQRDLIDQHQFRINQQQTQHYQQLMSIKMQFDKKQHSYNQLISKVIYSLSQARNAWKNIYDNIHKKCLNLANIVQNYKESFQHNKFLSNAIIQLVSDLNIRKQQDSILSRKSLQLSSCFVEASPQNRKYQKLSSNPYTDNINIQNGGRKDHLDYSSIQFRQQNQYEDQNIPVNENKDQLDQIKDVQTSLRIMIFSGLFTQQNRKKVNKMIDISNSLSQYYQLVNQPIYPLMLQILNLKWDDFQRSLESKDITLSQISYSQSNIMIEEGPKLRNIETLQDLEVRENIPPQRDIYFKKKKK